MQQGGGPKFVHEDPVTKSKRVTDMSGAVVSSVEMDPWGADTPRSANAAFQPRRFTTYERDQNGSDEAMFRRYSRSQARFEQPDPYEGSYNLADPQSFNRYAYVQNDPVNFLDPTGLLENLFDYGYGAQQGYAGFGGWGYLNPAREYRLLGHGVYSPELERWVWWGGLYTWDVWGGFFGGGRGLGGPHPPQQGEPCPPVPQAPPGADLNANIRSMEESLENARNPPDVGDIGAGAFRGGVGLGHAAGFASLVAPGGRWDYKQQDVANGSYIAFGNFNYGATGAAAGFSEGKLLRAAGFVQKWFGDTKGDGGRVNIINALTGKGGQAPFEDQKIDQENIKLGILYYQRGCHKR